MRRFWYGCAVAGLAAPVLAQNSAGQSAAGDPMAAPTQYGVRFTPGMSRAIAGWVVREVFVEHYELEQSKADQAAEMMARRIMQTAHQHEEAGQELLEFAFAQMMEQEAREHEGGPRGLSEETAGGLGTRVLPLMPSIRSTANAVMQDIRPMLSFKQQVRFTAEVAAMNVALDALEKNLQNWAAGEVEPFNRSPFEVDESRTKKEADGQTKFLKRVYARAEEVSKQAPGGNWSEYVEGAKKYYQFDGPQCAAADSLLREYSERARLAISPENEWRARRYREVVWFQMSMELPGRWWSSPLYLFLYNRWEKKSKPLRELGDELKNRIDEIPTQAQRSAAEDRIWAEFAKQDLKAEEIMGTASTPANSREGSP